MRTVSIDELKRNVSAFVEAAATGARIIITKHRRPVASLSPANLEHVHIGARHGKGAALKPLLRAPTGGQYLEALAEEALRGAPPAEGGLRRPGDRCG
jgi:prevent-host-death family protein